MVGMSGAVFGQDTFNQRAIYRHFRLITRPGRLGVTLRSAAYLVSKGTVIEMRYTLIVVLLYTK